MSTAYLQRGQMGMTISPGILVEEPELDKGASFLIHSPPSSRHKAPIASNNTLGPISSRAWLATWILSDPDALDEEKEEEKRNNEPFLFAAGNPPVLIGCLSVSRHKLSNNALYFMSPPNSFLFLFLLNCSNNVT